ncbi:glycosyltransferase [Macrococcus capreoli]|uniref:glycosyltransferase n=1 Tax=Macrococcus capreoli TaxID=2982690 RepID=UPI003EE54685
MKNIIIVLNYNDYETTENFINQVKEYDSLDKIIIVDNASPDLSYEKLKKYQNKKIDIIYNPKNDGYAKGNNFGIDYVNSNYETENIIISNPDIQISNESIKNMSFFLEENHEYASVTGLIRNSEHQIVTNYAWKQPSYSAMLFSSSLILNKLYSLVNPEYLFYQKPKEFFGFKDVQVQSGCFFMIRTNILKEVNNFDSSTFLYHEENLLFDKINKLGYKNAVLLGEKIIHFEGISVSKNFNSYLKKAKIMNESAEIYLNKSLKISNLKMKLFNLIFKFGSFEKYFYIKFIKNRKSNKR